MKVAYKTDIGKKRTHNEDSIIVDESMHIFLLADGMGGHQAGEVASDLAVKECYAWLKEHIDKARNIGDVSNLLIESLLKAHHTVKARATTDINLAGMGTTFIQMLVVGNNAHICHVGDSRAYHLGSEIKQITQDHTSEMYFVKEGIAVEGVLPVQKMRVLTQAVGGQATPVPEIKQVKLHPKDILLLCSDGLTDMLSDKEIESVIQKYRDNLPVTADNLIHEANDKGGIDNISVILIEYE
ncbi:MAG: serine/threonine-protein phosphatase [Planctomycetes bacterium]|uniref:PP2C family protein-serine/threonine phosphatase n=1 Tax=Candidatus Wunengus sp. YC65 TaxID=3367701 RepID=UPI001D764BA3|nr:serine/threonine-protein phosphatase [Planctomycetota bacterium]